MKNGCDAQGSAGYLVWRMFLVIGYWLLACLGESGAFDEIIGFWVLVIWFLVIAINTHKPLFFNPIQPYSTLFNPFSAKFQRFLRETRGTRKTRKRLYL